MPLKFDRPVGACCDVSELEYIAALHQTGSDIRRDGSINAIDIISFLASRYGIKVSEEEVKKTILLGLGGGGDDEDCIDMVETVAILLIPYFLKSSKKKRAGTSVDDQADLNEHEGHDNVIQQVLNMILHDVTESTSPPTLDKDRLVQILKFYGEHEIIEDDELLEGMIVAARGTEDRENTVLDLASFIRALTSDVTKYDTGYESSFTSNYYDVFKAEMTGHRISVKSETNEDGWEMNVLSHDESADTSKADKRDVVNTEGMTNFEKRGTMGPIDYTADTFGSSIYVALLWASFISVFFTYIYSSSSEVGWTNLACLENQYGCKLGQSILSWIMTFLELSIMGTVFVGFGSLGTSAYGGSVIMLFLGMATVVLCTIVSCFVYIKTPFFDTNDYGNPSRQILQYITLTLGCALVVMQFMFLLEILAPEIVKERCQCIMKYLIDNIKRETYIKRAASKKINTLVTNAIDMCMLEDHASANSKNYQSRALLNFMKYDLETENVGGFWWAHKRLFAGILYQTDGVWISGRVSAGVASLFCAILFILVISINHIVDVSKASEEMDLFEVFLDTSLDEDAYDYMETILDETGINVTEAANSAEGAISNQAGINVTEEANYIEDTMEEVSSMNKELVASLVFGGCIAVALAFFTATTYIPSTVTTILKLRSGVIPSLHSDDFIKYRKSVDSVTYVIGYMFWGVLYSSAITGFIFSAVFFFFTSPDTREYALGILISLAGLAITIGFKTVVMTLLRKTVKAYYRNEPKLSNFTGLIFECWDFGTSVGFMLARVGKLIASAILFIGRVDSPILAPGVGLFGVELDSAPATYMKDILAHEAHRHPYIERLGVMYLMKLRYGKDFAKTSGTIWRMLFVFALMPWLRQYRVMTRPEETMEPETPVTEEANEVKGEKTSMTLRVRSLFKSGNK